MHLQIGNDVDEIDGGVTHVLRVFEGGHLISVLFRDELPCLGAEHHECLLP